MTSPSSRRFFLFGSIVAAVEPTARVIATALQYPKQKTSVLRKTIDAATVGRIGTVAENAVGLLTSTMSYSQGTKLGTMDGGAYLVAAHNATDHHLITAGKVKLYVQPLNGAYYASHFGIEPGLQNGAALSNAIAVAAAGTGRLFIDIEGTICVTGKQSTNGRIYASKITNLHLTIRNGCRIFSVFDIGADGVLELFEFEDCANITIDGRGTVEVEVADNAPASRTTFRVFHFNGKSVRADGIKIFGPLKIYLHGCGDSFAYDPNYAGYGIHLNSTDDPADQPNGFVCHGVDFSGSSGRLIQTVGARGATITRNTLHDIGAHFVTVGIRSLGDAAEQTIAANQISVASAHYVVSCITLGTNNVGRVGLAKNNSIAQNRIHHTVGAVGVFLNASANTKIQRNTFSSDGRKGSPALRIQLVEKEVSLGANKIANAVFSDNTLINVHEDVHIAKLSDGGQLINFKTYSNNAKMTPLNHRVD